MCLNGAQKRCGNEAIYAKLKGKIFTMMNKMKTDLGLEQEEAEGGIFDQFKKAKEEKSEAA